MPDIQTENIPPGRPRQTPEQFSEDYPRVDKEDSVVLPLSGTNESPQVVMCGWTKHIVKGFPNLKTDLNIQSVMLKDVQRRSSWPKNFTPDLLDNTRDLSNFAAEAQERWSKIFIPISVIVLAKRNIQPMIKNGKLLIFGETIVGDESGFCILLSINNAIQTLYRQVEIGDRILINDGLFKKRQQSAFKLCFDDNFHLNLELKATHYQCRRVFRLIDISPPVFPVIITAGKQLKLPSDLLGPNSSTPCNEFLDIIGVISYVGRVERNWTSQWVVEKEEGQNFPFQVYYAHRWLELVDANVGNLLPVTLYLNQNNWGLQARLTPGCVIIITNVSRSTSAYYGHPRLQSSVFTQVYINADIGKYMERLPGVASNSTMELFGSGSMYKILGREDICWSGGGMYSQPFDPDFEPEFYKVFIENPDEPDTKKVHRVPNLPFARRESQRIYFKGRILKFRTVTVEGTGPLWCSKNFPVEVFKYTKFNSIFPFIPQRNWYAFTKGFPKLDYKHLLNETYGKRTRLNEFACESYQKYCSALLMPPTDCTHLRDLPILDGPPYYWAMIVDDEKRHLYECIWKPSKHMNVNQMAVKLEQSQDEPVIGIIDFFCMNDRANDVLKYEIHLQDFTTILGPPEPKTVMEEKDVDTDEEFKNMENELEAMFSEPTPMET